jgi:hypothetical protein
MASRVILSRTVEMERAEEALCRSMVTSITGTRSVVMAREVENVLCDSFELRDGEFTMHLHHPEDFLIIFHSKEALDWMAGDHFINGPGFCLSVRPWCKLAHAGSSHFKYHVDLEIYGIPPQAWHLSKREHILGASCWIEKLYPTTRTRDDLATFRLSGYSHDPQEIKCSSTLEIVELIPTQGTASSPTVRTLTYPISVIKKTGE